MSNIKKILYLIQGEARNVSNYFFLDERHNSDALFLTYDEKLAKAIFYPNSTWAEGRNKLYEAAKSLSCLYDYYIYLDDDIGFVTGSYDSFEAELLLLKPVVGVPIVPKTKLGVLKLSDEIARAQICMLNDEQFLAISKDAFFEGKILPYVTKYDSISAWAACEIQQAQLQTFYQPDFVQFNYIEVDNLIHGRHNKDDKSYKPLVKKWLEEKYENLQRPWYYWEDLLDVNVGLSTGHYLKNKNLYSKSFQLNFEKLVKLTSKINFQ